MQGATPGDAEEIKEGDRVKVRSLDREGIVEYIRDGSYVVMIGPLRYHAERNDLIKISGSKAATSAASHSLISDAPEEICSELKVIGLTADEALDRVDKFLDQAYLAGVENVRIIHGHGKGILRKAIAKFLAEHPQVERFSLATPDQGGGGATLVELKK